MKYNCDICSYATCDKSNFNKHMSSKAHAKRSKIDLVLGQKRQLKLPSGFQCPNCEKIYSSASSLSKHKNKVCKIGSITRQVKIQLEQEFNEKVNDIVNEKVKQKELEIKLEYTEKLVDELKQCMKNTRPTTYNISVKKLVQQTYPNAPPLAMLENYGIIHDDDTDFTQDLIYYHSKDRLYAYLGDIIIKFYKKEDPKDQSLWSTDSSRLKYIIKELIATKKSNWSEDDKGLKTIKYIIDPLLEYIGDYANDKIDDLHEEIYNSSAIECIEINQKQFALSGIREQILNGALKDEIVKYITPSFKFKTDKLIIF